MVNFDFHPDIPHLSNRGTVHAVTAKPIEQHMHLHARARLLSKCFSKPGGYRAAPIYEGLKRDAGLFRKTFLLWIAALAFGALVMKFSHLLA
jgi:hypothetical protein